MSIQNTYTKQSFNIDEPKIGFDKNLKMLRLEQEVKNLQKRIHSPKVDLIEREDYYMVRIEIPGIDKNSIRIQIKEQQIVLISGTKLPEEIFEEDNIIYRESRFDRFMRRVKLPGQIEYTEFQDFDLLNGVLKLKFNKLVKTETEIL